MPWRGDERKRKWSRRWGGDIKKSSPSIGFEEKRLLPFDFPAEMFKILLKPGAEQVLMFSMGD